jgi:hypothetical protein
MKQRFRAAGVPTQAVHTDKQLSQEENARVAKRWETGVKSVMLTMWTWSTLQPAGSV